MNSIALTALVFAIFGGSFGSLALGRWRRLLSLFDRVTPIGAVMGRTWRAVIHLGWLFVLPCLVLLVIGQYPFQPVDLLVGSGAGFVACILGERLHRRRRER